MIDEYYTFKIFGYHSGDLSYGSGKRVVAVCDECKTYRSLKMKDYRDICVKCMHKGLTPLSDGWKSKLSDVTNNKSSPVYLGSIAETILSNVYNDVQVMPNCNHGFDIICSRDMKIDIKSSAVGDKRGYWKFNINKNKVADYFLCIAFNNRCDLYNPVHLWLIPGHKVNHLISLSLRKGTLDKWSKYELPLNKLAACCNNLKP